MHSLVCDGERQCSQNLFPIRCLVNIPFTLKVRHPAGPEGVATLGDAGGKTYGRKVRQKKTNRQTREGNRGEKINSQKCAGRGSGHRWETGRQVGRWVGMRVGGRVGGLISGQVGMCGNGRVGGKTNATER